MWSARHRVLAWMAILAGAGLRIRLFTANYSLSLDEAAIARNLIDRQWWQLLGPIDYAQVAPPGFLLIEKAVVAILGSGELALRVVPLAAGLAALWVARAIVLRAFEPVTGLCGLALIAFCPPFVEYSAIAKPYSSDVAASLAVLWLTMAAVDLRRSTLRRWAAVAALAIVPLFSFTAIFTIAAAAIAIWSTRREAAARLAQSLVVAAAAGAGAVIGRLSLSAADREYMNWFWTDGFMPLTPATTREWLWLWRQTAGVFGQTAHYRGATLWLALAAVGAWWLWRRDRREIAIACALPVVLTLGASAARVYPFGPGRVHLFLMPLLLLLVASGLEAAARRTPRISVQWLAAVVVAVTTLTGRPWSIPPQMSDVRAFVSEFAARRAPGDRVYVYYWSAQPFLYYAPRLGLSPSDYVVGRCSMGAGRGYLRELESVSADGRLWLAMPQTSNLERDTILEFLGANGRHVETLSGFGYVYDLSRQDGRGRVPAATFPLPELLAAAEPFRLTCYGVFLPLRD